MSDDAVQDLAVSLALAGEDFLCQVVSVRGEEELSRSFTYEIELRATPFPFNAMVGQQAVLTLRSRRADDRLIAGTIVSAEAELVPLAESEDLATYRLTVIPDATYVLGYRTTCRIFQGKTVPEIVKALCKATGLDDERFVWAKGLGRYPTRDYCVQYNESDWDFLCRLLEEEGIFFWFEHGEKGSTLCFADRNEDLTVLDDPIPFAYDREWHGRDLAVWAWRQSASLVPSRVVLADYDRQAAKVNVEESEGEQTPPLEHYEYPGRFGADLASATRLAETYRLAFLSAGRTSQAATNALTLQPGRAFDVVNHPLASLRHVVRRVTIDLELGETIDAAHAAEELSHPRLQIETSPFDIRFAPLRKHPRPLMQGFQTARVTGPAGEEIHCDALGRVKVQFPWDREGQLDEHTSCWLPVTQEHTTGSVMVPRIGWEVLVSFVDGDPDRPTCLGKVWNFLNTPPVVLPDCKTTTQISSESSPGGGGRNHIAFDDAAGSESIAIEGHSAILLTAGNDAVSVVGHNFTHEVAGTRTAEVGANESIAVLSNWDDRVVGAQSITTTTRAVKVSGCLSEENKADYTLDVGGLEMVKVGNPIQAVLDVVTSKVVAAAKGAAIAAASRAVAPVLKPLEPVMKKAKETLGPAWEAAGQATTLFKAMTGESPLPKELQEANDKISPYVDAAKSALEAGSFAEACIDGAMEKALADDSDGNAGGGEGGGGGGGDAGPEGALAATAGGTGTWKTNVTGNVTESVGGLAVINTTEGITLTVGGLLKETIGAARVELIKGGKTEDTGTVKAETVGLYSLKAKESIAFESGGAFALNIAGAQKQKIKGGYSLSAKGPLIITAPKLKLQAGTSISLVCGDVQVVLDSSGVVVKGASDLTIEGNPVTLDENAIG